MEPIPEAEVLRSQLQQGHTDYVRNEIDLAVTLLDWNRLERRTRDVEAANQSLERARQASDGARRGLAHIQSAAVRALLESKLEKVEARIQLAEESQSTRT